MYLANALLALLCRPWRSRRSPYIVWAQASVCMRSDKKNNNNNSGSRNNTVNIIICLWQPRNKALIHRLMKFLRRVINNWLDFCSSPDVHVCMKHCILGAFRVSMGKSTSDLDGIRTHYLLLTSGSLPLKAIIHLLKVHFLKSSLSYFRY